MSKSAKGSEWLEADQVATQIGVGLNAVYKMAREGRLPGYLIGGSTWRFKENEIHDFIEQSKNARNEVTA